MLKALQSLSYLWMKKLCITSPILDMSWFSFQLNRNFKLLSFGEEAEEDEEESNRENVKFVGKGKSSHDVLSK